MVVGIVALPLVGGCGHRADPLEGAVAPLLTRLDRDHDGRVTAPEYDAVAYASPAFAVADVDHDGALEAAELAALLRTQDPVYFDKRQDFARTGTRHFQSLKPAAAGVYETRTLRDLYRFLAEEIAARGGAPPDDATITAAVATGSLGSPESVAVLAALEAGAAGVGLEFPARLRAGAGTAGATGATGAGAAAGAAP
jgi:hypothetical protein